ncbi:DUF5058 family protein [Microbacterium sp. gxy059]|uniref:DUF5058 family protein n=1 Tax=Microbacterium sp. gxy059 TaxID=2957199 RepID=UPI003D95109A
MPPHALSLDPDSLDVLAAANSPAIWVSAIGVFLIIGVQTLIYYRAVRRTAPAVGMSADDVKRSYRTGITASLDPSLAICLIAITLISVFGTPGVLIRIGLVGSAPYEVAASGAVAGTLGTSLGGAGFTQEVFATVLLSIGNAGAMWMVVTLIATPLLKRGGARLEGGRGAATMAIISTAALLGAFITFGPQEISHGLLPTLAILSGALVMGARLLISRLTGRVWLKQWGLGIAIVVGIAFIHVLTTLGLA